MSAPLRVEAAVEGDRAVLVLAGDLRFGTAQALEQHLAALDGPPDLLVDVSDVDLCDSAGLAALIGLQRRAARRGGSVALAGVSGTLRRILRLTGTEMLFAQEAQARRSGTEPA